ncbi:hypothetical protein [Paraburkholderia aromaticivorans]|uniref:hypothetical protein n=1 Tax=Paraburkholderia aromaticivorans TaxID=2026199 RepID=UPI001456115D|nr:hypothetical protein [Paraburkholderia aromaticivorans]
MTYQENVMKSQQDLRCEINQCAIRMESRVVQLGDHVGANLRTKMRTDVHEGANGIWVDVDACDVSISRIRTALREAGIKEKQVPVRPNGKTIAIAAAE